MIRPYLGSETEKTSELLDISNVSYAVGRADRARKVSLLGRKACCLVAEGR